MIHSIVAGVVFTVMVLAPCAIAYFTADHVETR
jgi:hypothetical protein